MEGASDGGGLTGLLSMGGWVGGWCRKPVKRHVKVRRDTQQQHRRP